MSGGKRFRGATKAMLRDLQKEHRAGTVGGRRPKARLPIVAVDLGYGAKGATTGVFFTGETKGKNLKFGAAVKRVARVYRTRLWTKAEGASASRAPLLVVEAALSGLHGPDGCPRVRVPGETEDYPWFLQAGAVTALAGIEFCRALDRALGNGYGKRVDLAEAFLPTSMAAARVGQKSLVHWKVARMLHDDFRKAAVHHVAAWRPLSPHVRGAPAVLDYR